MSAILHPGEAQGPWETIGDLRRRVASLEATPAGDFDGIRFDVDNIGGGLYVQTNNDNPHGGPVGKVPGLWFDDFGGGVKFSTSEYFIVDAGGAAPSSISQIKLTSDTSAGSANPSIGLVTIAATDVNNSGIRISTQATGTANTSGVVITSGAITGVATGMTATSISTNNSTGTPTTGIAIVATLVNGSADVVGLDVRAKHTGSGAGGVFPIRAYDNTTLIFEIDSAGNLHIPAAAAVINDL